jgi:alpha-D-xyloside xylohydrolase
VFTADGIVDYYVPPGEWIRLRTGERVSGPRWVRERHGFDSVPLLVRPGAVIPLGAVEDRPDYDYADGVTLLVTDLADGASVTTTVPTATGEVACTFTTTRRGDTVHVEADDAPSRWRVRLFGRDPVEVDGAATTVQL